MDILHTFEVCVSKNNLFIIKSSDHLNILLWLFMNKLTVCPRNIWNFEEEGIWLEFKWLSKSVHVKRNINKSLKAGTGSFHLHQRLLSKSNNLFLKVLYLRTPCQLLISTLCWSWSYHIFIIYRNYFFYKVMERRKGKIVAAWSVHIGAA